MVTFKCTGERWCFDIPREKVFHGKEAEPYLNLKTGDIITSWVGHFDYNTASFEVELEVIEAVTELDGSIYYNIKLIGAKNSWGENAL